jgi:hypothetical protein
MVAGDSLASFTESLKLIGQATGRGIVVIIPMADNIAVDLFASEVSLFADSARLGKMNKADPIIVCRQQIAHVLAVRKNQ